MLSRCGFRLALGCSSYTAISYHDRIRTPPYQLCYLALLWFYFLPKQVLNITWAWPFNNSSTKYLIMSFNHIASFCDGSNKLICQTVLSGLKLILFPDIVHDRQEVEMLPSHRDVEGASFGIARLHSLYGINTQRMVQEGIIETHFNNKDVLSVPSVMKFNSKFKSIFKQDLFDTSFCNKFRLQLHNKWIEIYRQSSVK